MPIINPYANVNWVTQQKANFHTHTKEVTIGDILYGSDGKLTQQEVIDAYYGADYNILALTDHYWSGSSQVTTYPWSVFSRDPATLGILAVEGKELSYGNHIGSLFNNLGVSHTVDESVSLTAVRNNGGLAIINHPGRYAETIDFYVDLFMAFKDITVGLEVHNQGDRYPNDRKTWDLINAITIPLGKVVYGYSNDDMHNTTHLFRNYNYILSPLTEADVKTAMLAGNTYFCYESGGTGDAKAPRISNVEVDNVSQEIVLTVDSGTVSWVSDNTVQVGTGASFCFSGFTGTFVRAEITNDYGITYTQPFTVTQMYDIGVTDVYCKRYGVWIKSTVYGKKYGVWGEAENIKTS